jgi:hypothetical protein
MIIEIEVKMIKIRASFTSRSHHEDNRIPLVKDIPFSDVPIVPFEELSWILNDDLFFMHMA